MRMPAIFVGHGSPMLAIEDNDYTREWKAIGKQFKPKAILVISAHWYTSGNRTQDEPKPKKIDDMYGFPKALYDLEYPVNGDQALTDEVEKLLGDEVVVDNSWGIDHGSWAVLVHMYPDVDIPIVQLSVDGTKSPKEQFELGQKLSVLRDRGYMILGSGNVVHNLRRIDPNTKGAFDWASDFDDYIEKAIRDRDYKRCIDYLAFGEASRLSVPTPDHFYPLLNILGAVKEEDKLTVFNKGYDMGSLSMTGYLFV